VAQLPQAVAVLVWVIALGGLAVFVWRRLQGIPIRTPKPDAGADSSSVAPPLATSFPSAEPSAATFPPLSSSPPATAPVTPPAAPPATPPAAPPTTPPEAPPDAPLAASEPAASSLVPPAAPVEGRSGFFATPDPAVGAAVERAGRATVAEAVRGIEMPSGLSPVIDGSQSIPNPFRAAFLTSEADASTVGAALADELERLGFTLSTSTPTELLARRDAVELRVVLYVKPEAAKRGLDRIFPAAPPGSVGVELST